MTDLGVPGLDGLLQQTVEVLQLAQARRDSAGASQGSGEAADGLVQASAAAGRLQSLSLKPDAMQMTPAELAAAIVSAANQALGGEGTPGAWASYGSETAGVENADARELAARVAEIQEQGIRQMRQIGQAIADIMSEIRKGD